MTSRRPFWRSETKKQRPCWRSEISFWELNSIFMQILPFVLVCKYCCWSYERKHCIITEFYTQTNRCIQLDHFQKCHNILCLASKFCISIISSFSWDLQWSIEKFWRWQTKTIFESGLYVRLITRLNTNVDGLQAISRGTDNDVMCNCRWTNKRSYERSFVFVHQHGGDDVK